MKKKYLLGLGGIIAIIAVLVLALTQVHSVRSGSPIQTPTPTYDSQFTPDGTNVLAWPTTEPPKVTDLSPNVKDIDKVFVLIQHADGSREMFLIVPEEVDAFIKRLPVGDKLLGTYPNPSLVGQGIAPTITPGP
jgi:hypothetical protein